MASPDWHLGTASHSCWCEQWVRCPCSHCQALHLDACTPSQHHHHQLRSPCPHRSHHKVLADAAPSLPPPIHSQQSSTLHTKPDGLVADHIVNAFLTPIQCGTLSNPLQIRSMHSHILLAKVASRIVSNVLDTLAGNDIRDEQRPALWHDACQMN